MTVATAQEIVAAMISSLIVAGGNSFVVIKIAVVCILASENAIKRSCSQEKSVDKPTTLWQLHPGTDLVRGTGFVTTSGIHLGNGVLDNVRTAAFISMLLFVLLRIVERPKAACKGTFDGSKWIYVRSASLVCTCSRYLCVAPAHRTQHIKNVGISHMLR